MAGSKSGPKTATNDKCRGKSDSAQDKDTAASGGGPVSGPKMSGLKQRKVADGVNKIKKQRKSKASVAASKDAGEAKSSSNGTGTTGNDHPSNVSNTASLTSVSAAPVPSVRRANGKRVRRKHDPNAWTASTPSLRTNVLCLGVSYPFVKHQLIAERVDPRVLHYSDTGVDQTVELVQRNILTEMDGRDLVRCLAMEEGDDTRAYCVSLESGAQYGARHLHANFNRVKFISQMKKTWGRVKFRQIILDYFWIPRGTWVMSHWSRSFFDAILPSFVTEGMIDFSCGDEVSGRKVNSRLQAHSTSGSGGGVVYLPFCLHCVKEVTAAIDTLSKYYTISFLHKSELAEHALWSATNSIDPDVMQRQFGKAIAQEEVYCKFKPQEAYSAAEDAHISKKEVIQVLRGIEDFEDIRMMKLTALKKFDPEYRGSTASDIVGVTKGGYVGLKNPSEVVRGFDHVGKATKKPSKAAVAKGKAKAQQPVAVPVSVSEASAPATGDAKKAEKSKKRKRAPTKSAKPSAAKKNRAKAKAKAKTAGGEVVKKPRAKKRADKSVGKTSVSTPSETKNSDGEKKYITKKSKSLEKKVDQGDAVKTVEVDMTAVTPLVGASKQKSMVDVRKSPRASSAGLGLVTPSPAQVEASGHDATTSSSPDDKPAQPETGVTQTLTMPSPASLIDQGTMVRDKSSVSLCPSLKSSPDVSEDDSSEVEIPVPSPTLRTPTKNSKEKSDEESGIEVKREGGKRKRLDSFPSSLECLPAGKTRFRPRQPLKKRKHTKRVESVLATTGVAPRRSPRKSNTASGAFAPQTPILRGSPKKSKDPHASVLYPPVSVPFPPGDVLASVGVQKESNPTKNQLRRAPRKMWKQRAQVASAEKRKLQERLIGEARVRMFADLERAETSDPCEDFTTI